MYRRLHSYPGFPNCGPAAVTASNLIEPNPNGRCTVKIATSRSTVNGMLARVTNAPNNTANPPMSSVSMLTHAMRCGAGTPNAWSTDANTSGPRDSFRNAWTMNPYPTRSRNGMGAHRENDKLLLAFEPGLQSSCSRD